MIFLGYPIAEWATLATLITMLFGCIAWGFKMGVTNPLNEAIKGLQKTIDRIDKTAKDNHALFDARLDSQETRLEVHEQRIKANEARINKLEEHDL